MECFDNAILKLYDYVTRNTGETDRFQTVSNH